MQALESLNALMRAPVENDDSTAVVLTFEEKAAWVWTQVSTSQDRGVVFWLTQVLALGILAASVLGFSSLWDTYFDARAGRLVDRYIDLTEKVSRPLTRVMRRCMPVVKRIATRCLPRQYLDEARGQLLFATHGLTIVLLGLLAALLVMAGAQVIDGSPQTATVGATSSPLYDAYAFVEFNDALYFSANTDDTGREVFYVDTVRAKRIPTQYRHVYTLWIQDSLMSAF